MKAVLFPILITVFFSSFQPLATGGSAIENRPKPSAFSSTVNKNVLLKLVNEVRAKGCQCGDTYYNPAPAVSWNSQLEQAAFFHSVDMFQQKYFSHIAPDNSRGGTRIERVGYSWKAYGENIAMGYNNEKAVLQGWIKSPGHCKNLMNKAYTEMGVARAGTYWTQEFATR